MVNVEDIAKEFDDFAYIIAHDMASPQRHIREFTKLLLASLDQPLSEEQLMYKKYIEQGLERIEKMQEALSIFSRISTKGNPFSAFNSRQPVIIALDRLQDLIDETKAQVTMSSILPDVLGDIDQIAEVFFRIIENALTYAVKDKAPIIHIEAEEMGDRVYFTMRDNGIGMDPQYIEEIFTIFRKLHTAGTYKSGIGAGLAIARKIIRRHGGDIKVHSELGKGTSLTFSIAKA